MFSEPQGGRAGESTPAPQRLAASGRPTLAAPPPQATPPSHAPRRRTAGERNTDRVADEAPRVAHADRTR